MGGWVKMVKGFSKKTNLIDTEHSMMTTRGESQWEEMEESKGGDKW